MADAAARFSPRTLARHARAGTSRGGSRGRRTLAGELSTRSFAARREARRHGFVRPCSALPMSSAAHGQRRLARTRTTGRTRCLPFLGSDRLRGPRPTSEPGGGSTRCASCSPTQGAGAAAATVPRMAWRARSHAPLRPREDGQIHGGQRRSRGVVTGGAFLGGTAQRGGYSIVSLEEHPLDVARRLLKLGAAAEGARTCTCSAASPLTRSEELRAKRRGGPARLLVVIDTLAAFAAAYEAESGDAKTWQRVVQGITDIGRAGDAACSWPTTKGSGPARPDSTAIAAAVDVVIEDVRGRERPPAHRATLMVRGRFRRGPAHHRLPGRWLRHA